MNDHVTAIERCLDCPYARRRTKASPYVCHEPRAKASALHPAEGRVEDRAIYNVMVMPPSWCPLRTAAAVLVLAEGA